MWRPQLPLCFPNSRDTYPLFTSVIPPLEKQNQLLSHDLVAEREKHLFSEMKILKCLFA